MLVIVPLFFPGNAVLQQILIFLLLVLLFLLLFVLLDPHFSDNIALFNLSLLDDPLAIFLLIVSPGALVGLTKHLFLLDYLLLQSWKVDFHYFISNEFPLVAYVIADWVAQIGEVHSDLVRFSSYGLALHKRGVSVFIVPEFLEHGSGSLCIILFFIFRVASSEDSILP